MSASGCRGSPGLGAKPKAHLIHPFGGGGSGLDLHLELHTAHPQGPKLLHESLFQLVGRLLPQMREHLAVALQLLGCLV